MRNYISINAKYYKAKEIKRINNHNERISKVDYLLDESLVKYKNLSKDYSNDFDGNLIDTFNQSMIRKEANKRSNKPTSAMDNELVEMVIALSREQAEHYLEIEGEAGLFRGFKQCMMDIKDKYGFEPLGLSLHLDEGHIDKESGNANLNIHAHAVFHNFDFNTNKTVLRTLRRQDWKDMQDLVAGSFQKQGLDFIRGEAKLENGKDHLERNDFIATKQMIELKNLRVELTKSINVLNSNKNEVKSLRLKYERQSKEYEVLSGKLKDAREEEQRSRILRRDLDVKIKELNDKLEQKEKTIQQHNNTIKNQEQRLNELYKTNIEDIRNDMTSKFGLEILTLNNTILDHKEIYIKNLNSKNKELETLKRSNRELLEQNHEMIERLEELDLNKTNKRRMR